jgi:hypothetical protein
VSQEPEESEQLPEEAPEDVADDDSRPGRRPKDNPGVPGEGGQATGNPDNAG